MEAIIVDGLEGVVAGRVGGCDGFLLSLLAARVLDSGSGNCCEVEDNGEGEERGVAPLVALPLAFHDAEL